MKLKIYIPAFLLMISINVNAENFDKPYIGINLNYINASDDGEELSFNGAKGWGVWEENGWGTKNKIDDVGIGFQLGKNWVYKDYFLYGIELGYQKNKSSDENFQRDLSNGDDCAPASDCIFKTELNHTFTTTLKAGYLITDKIAVYLLGGYTTSKVKRKIYDGWDQGRWITDTKWQDGYVYGGGLDYLFNQNISLKLEYRYSDLGIYTYSSEAFTGVKEKQDLDISVVSLGLNYLF